MGSVRLDGLSAAVQRTPSGDVRVAGLSPPPPARPAAAPAAGAPPSWKVSLARVEVSGVDVRITDQAVSPAARFRLSPLNVALTGDLATPGGPMGVEASTRINGAASLSACGAVNPGAPGAELDVNLAGLPLAWVKPYMAVPAALDVRSGVASARDAFTFDGRNPSRPDFSWKGSAAVDGFAVYETEAQSQLAAWKRFSLEGMDLTPRGLRIASGRLSGLDARLEVLPDTSPNIRALLEEDPEAAARAEALKGADLKTLRGSASRAEKKRSPRSAGRP